MLANLIFRMTLKDGHNYTYLRDEEVKAEVK